MRRREFITLVGGAVVWPFTTRAQQSTMPVIGYMSARSPEDTVQVLEAFYKGLGEGGFVKGRTSTLSTVGPKAITAGSRRTPPSWCKNV